MSDEDILEAAGRVIGRRGPAAFTLRDVADECGLAPATLLQRFKTKRGLLVAFATAGAEGVDPWFAEARATAATPRAALLEALAAGARTLRSPQEAANHLALLQMDLSDPDLRAPTLAFFQAFRRNVQALLEEAAAARELRPHTDAMALARAVECAYHGALLTWTVHREGKPEEAVRVVVEGVLGAARGGAGGLARGDRPL